MSTRDLEHGLLHSATRGDIAALQRLLLAHFSTLERYIAPHIPPTARRQLGPEDILQEVFSQAFRDIGQFNSTTNGSFYTWLKAIADHRLADALKRIGRKKRGGDRHQLSVVEVAKSDSVATLIDLVCQDSRLPEKSAARREVEKALQVASTLR